MDFERLSAGVRALGLGAQRDPIRRAAYRGLPYESAGLEARAAERLEREAPRLSFKATRVARSADGTAAKAILTLKDGLEVESVLLRPSPSRWTACLSSQAGCGLGCSFCATGLMGFKRDLTAEEIADQALFWRLELGGAEAGPQNLVFMGMGEPLANYDGLAAALRELSDDLRYGFAPGRVAVSTAGVAPAIERFAGEFPAFPLAVSLHSAVGEVRDRLVPINRKYPLDRLAAALKTYLRRSTRKVMVEYVLLKGLNESPSDAEALASYLASIGPKERFHVNLIDYNPTATPHAAADEASARTFHEALRRAGLAAVRRRNRGRDVAGACGQLR